MNFSAGNLNNGTADTFGIQKTDVACNYLEGNMSNDIVSELEVDTDNVAFEIGSFAVSYDTVNRRLKLRGGSPNDSLVLYQLRYPVSIENGTSLTLNTLIAQGFEATAFTNEGTVEAFISYFENCKTVENKGQLSSCNLFLLRSDIQNSGTICWKDANRAISGSIKNITDGMRKGRFKMSKNIGNANYAFDAKIAQYAQNSCSATLSSESDGKVTFAEKVVVAPQSQPIIIQEASEWLASFAGAMAAFSVK